MKTTATTVCALQDQPTFTTIDKVKKGEYFKIAIRSKHKDGDAGFYTTLTVMPTVYVADGYNRSTKKYSAYRFEDINHFIEKKKNTPVQIGFDF